MANWMTAARCEKPRWLPSQKTCLYRKWTRNPVACVQTAGSERLMFKQNSWQLYKVIHLVQEQTVHFNPSPTENGDPWWSNDRFSSLLDDSKRYSPAIPNLMIGHPSLRLRSNLAFRLLLRACPPLCWTSWPGGLGYHLQLFISRFLVWGRTFVRVWVNDLHQKAVVYLSAWSHLCTTNAFHS